MNATFVLLYSCAVLASAAPAAASPVDPVAAPGASVQAPSATAPPPGANDPLGAWSRPVGVREVLAAQPFVLTQPFESDWRLERPEVRSGWILVLEVDSAVARVRQVASPVLYVGDEVAERVNLGTPPGGEPGPTVRLIVIVSAPLDDAGEVTKLVGEVPIFFGSPMLPEQVDTATALRERAAATAEGLHPSEPVEVARARAQGGAPLQLADRTALLAATARHVRTWSPAESEQADLLEGRPITRVATPERP